jgi:hypothetical protein
MVLTRLPELWEWAEYYCPWCYIAAVRLRKVMPEYEGRVRMRVRPFPLEFVGSGSAPRDILEQEWWLAAIQEPAAEFARYEGDDWPTTTPSRRLDAPTGRGMMSATTTICASGAPSLPRAATSEGARC